MVDIIIGSIPPMGGPTNPSTPTTQLVEAELLHVREPRQKIIGPLGQERRKRPRQDPQNGRVLTLLVPDGTILPKDLNGQKYRVMLRIVKK